MKKVAIIGASGYVGGELLRLLLFHKGVEIVAATSRANAGKKISEVHQNLNKLTDVEFTDESAEAVAGKADLVFFALPHCISMDTIPKVIGKTKIIDMSADYRLKDAEVFERYYKKKHCSSDLFNEFVYGLPEINRGKIKNAKNVANPGCFPAGAILALYPLAKQGLLEGNIVMDSKTGSSGSGAEPSFGTHHPERAEDFKAYKVFSHQHQPEM
ncbi:N-acetyl-gamma-glutamyl-phosphate reductase, partial [Candidatus Micrarchaeota archaeon]|nr:N-acetyl-gamma-glutamyl-phosphate reductase [Candidatus Micrarchaeota archaeon]